MYNAIPGFRINESPIYTGLYTIIFSGVHDSDNVNVVIKLLKDKYPSPNDIARFKHEYEVAKAFESEEDIVHVFSLEKHENSYAIIMENLTIPTLGEILEKEQKLNLELFLELAIHMTEALGHIHQNNIIHKDINPSNIMCDIESKTVKIIDFGLSANLPKERAEIVSPNVLEGTLNYLSPEQTGRMNRGIDYRTDYYSLGITFYQMLTGQLPFTSDDPMELVHYHIAVTPKSPHEIDNSIPKILSDIVMKLLAKNAEDRYQNANGLITDLSQCLEQLKLNGKIEPFKLGVKDIFSRFQIPEKLYGREDEVKTLLDTYDNVMQGKVELMLVAGYSGIGKSALVHEAHKPIVAKHGYFISGKFDQFKHNIPYAAVIQAFDEFVMQILTESEEIIDSFRAKILEAVGENGQVITEIIPNLISIIGEQPAVPELGPTESQNRFSYVFQNFISSLAASDHPLVLFLDDLQWADTPSLKLLETLLTSPDCQYLFIIGAYRSNEVSSAHPLMMELEEIKKRGVQYNTINLKPLALNNVSQLLGDTLHQDQESVMPLAQIAFEKTGGNPFFLIQLLLLLYKEQLISFDSRSNQWAWKLNDIKDKEISDNVVQLMINKLRELPAETQKVLQFASCIGNRFNLDLLSSSSGKEPETILIDLQEALKEGYIVSHGDAYRAVSYHFAHDRIQQAAYSLIDEDERKIIHINLARIILNKTSEDKFDEVIFDIANHYNTGIDPNFPDIIDATEKYNIAKLNLKASKAAQSAAAFEPALKYAQNALKCVDETAWESDYQFMLDLYTEAIETSYLTTKYDLMETYSEIALQKARNVFDKVQIIQIKALSFIAQLRQRDAVDIITDTLIPLGVTLPNKTSWFHRTVTSGLYRMGVKLANNPNLLYILGAIIKIKTLLLGKKIPELLNLPEMTDPAKKAAVKLITIGSAPAYQAHPALFPLLACTNVILSLKYGNTRQSAYAYVCFGVIACGVLGEIDSGYQFGDLSLDLLEKMREEETKARVVLMNYLFVKHWKDSLRSILPKVEDNFTLGLDSGDLEYASYTFTLYVFTSYFAGVPLKELLKKTETYMALVKNLQQTQNYYYMAIYQQTMLNLVEIRENPCLLVGTVYNETEMVPNLIKVNEKVALSWFYTNKLSLYYLFEDYSDVDQCINSAEIYEEGMLSMYASAIFQFYKGLILLATYPTKSKKEKRKAISAAKKAISKFKLWARHSPINHTHKLKLLQAELARVQGDFENAAILYDQAIDLAKQHEFLNEEALANEVAAKFYLAQNKEKIARVYMEEARHSYLVWGADAKVAFLNAHYPQLLGRAKEDSTITTKVSTSASDRTLSESLDINTIQKSSQAISSTIVLADLLKKLMRIVVENAGAQKSSLLLNKDGKYVIEAEGDVDHEDASVLKSIPISPDLLPVSMINYVIHSKESIVLGNATRSDRYGKDPYVVAKQPKSVICMPLLNQGVLSGILYLENNLTDNAFTSDRIKVLNLLSSQIAISIDNARLYGSTKDLNEQLTIMNKAYERFVPQDFLSLLQKQSIVDVGLGDQVQETMTILFTDIRNFTTISEGMTPEENFQFLNSFLSAMAPVIRKNNGFVDKFIGDAIMALYPNNADNALQCALDMRKALQQYNQERAKQGKSPIDIGIGINTGLLMLGIVGEKNRMNATVISDAVNIASRIETLTKSYKTPILISEDTFKNLKNPARYRIEIVDNQVLVKGKTKPIAVYKVENLG